MELVLMEKLVFEFRSEKVRDRFLAMWTDGGIADSMKDALAMHGINMRCDYPRAFREWGWDGKGDPVVRVIVSHRKS